MSFFFVDNIMKSLQCTWKVVFAPRKRYKYDTRLCQNNHILLIVRKIYIIHAHIKQWNSSYCWPQFLPWCLCWFRPQLFHHRCRAQTRNRKKIEIHCNCLCMLYKSTSFVAVQTNSSIGCEHIADLEENVPIASRLRCSHTYYRRIDNDAFDTLKPLQCARQWIIQIDPWILI